MTRIAAWSLALTFSICASAFADPVSVTILHTNDLHSHFRSERTPLGLGGIARIKTVVRRVRKQIPDALLVDGGDWSEGNIYYNEGTGRESLKMMDDLGYDVAVVGNHDWLNGPDTILKIVDEAQPQVSLVSANLDASKYGRAQDFRAAVLPYVIKSVDGVKIAFIGLSTYEKIYDHFFAPVGVLDPIPVTRALAKQLRPLVDAIVVISHNAVKMNQAVLEAVPELDLIVGAHDHRQLNAPIVVNRLGAHPGWIVETGCWGRNLGRVDMQVTPRAEADATGVPSVSLTSYHLTQIDSSIPEEPVAAAKILALEQKLENHYGPIFHDEIARSQVEITRDGMESLMGDLTADSFRAATGADMAVDDIHFIYGELHEGVIRTVDAYNADPAIHNPDTDKSWTLKTLPIKGRTLQAFFNIIFASKALAEKGLVSASGLELVYNPLFQSNLRPLGLRGALLQTIGLDGLFENGDDERALIIKSVTINGAPLDPSKYYQVALGNGVIETFNFINNSLLPNAIPMDGLQDTGVEGWRVMADYLHTQSPLNASTIAYGARTQSMQADLGVQPRDITWENVRVNSQGTAQATVHVSVHNYGATSTGDGAQLHLYANRRGADFSSDPDLLEMGAPGDISNLGPGEELSFSWSVSLAKDRGVYPVVARISGTDGEANHTNDEAVRFFGSP